MESPAVSVRADYENPFPPEADLVGEKLAIPPNGLQQLAVDDDPGEQSDRAAEQPEIAVELQTLMKSLRTPSGVPRWERLYSVSLKYVADTPDKFRAKPAICGYEKSEIALRRTGGVTVPLSHHHQSMQLNALVVATR